MLFCIAVAGKNATTTSKNLERLLSDFVCGSESPFVIIAKICNNHYDLAQLMKDFGFGCYNLKAKGFLAASHSGLDLRTCTVKDLEAIPGIGMKTSRFFILHTRKDADVACLDTHILQWMSYYTGFEVPKATPSKTKYLELEKAFLQIARSMNISPADLDLKIWNKQRGSDEESVVKARKATSK